MHFMSDNDLLNLTKCFPDFTFVNGYNNVILFRICFPFQSILVLKVMKQFSVPCER